MKDSVDPSIQNPKAAPQTKIQNISFSLAPGVAPLIYRSPDGLYVRDLSGEGPHVCSEQEWRDYFSRDNRFVLAPQDS